MRRVVWSTDALVDIGDALEFIANFDEDFARKLTLQLESAAQRLGQHSTGRPGRIVGTYEKSLPKLRYVIAYALDDPPGTVTILRVIHTSRKWPAGHWPPP